MTDLHNFLLNKFGLVNYLGITLTLVLLPSLGKDGNIGWTLGKEPQNLGCMSLEHL
jgi:hypothetical protein